MNGEKRIVLKTEGLEKSFPSGREELRVLRGVDLEIEAGEIVSIVGASGAGKSTLLHIAGGLLRPTAGRVWISGEELFHLGDQALSRLRNQRVGFVFQFHHLLPELTAEENVMMPLLIGNGGRREAAARAKSLLAEVGVSGRAHHHPHELSGGEQQRIAVARAVAARPEIVLADEPSGNLDDRNSEELHRLLWSLREEEGQAFAIVTHDDRLANRADRKLRLHEGRLIDDTGGAPRGSGVS
ncbi:MAG: ABC transporter ATP-binding protein [Candidatus Eisenbacteria bacterium]